MPTLLVRRHPAGQPLPPIYCKLRAQWQVDHWQFRALDLEPPDYGEPRTTFDAPNVVLGSPEATVFVQAAHTACAQTSKDKAALDARYQTDLTQATRPGTIFKGQLTHRGQVVPVEVRLLPVAKDGDAAQDVNVEVLLPATSGESFLYQARRSSQVPLEQPATAPAIVSSSLGMLASIPQGDLRLRLVQANGKEGPYNEAIPVKLLHLSRHEQQPTEIWLHLSGGHLEGRLAGYGTDPVGIVLSAHQQPPAP